MWNGSTASLPKSRSAIRTTSGSSRPTCTPVSAASGRTQMSARIPWLAQSITVARNECTIVPIATASATATPTAPAAQLARRRPAASAAIARRTGVRSAARASGAAARRARRSRSGEALTSSAPSSARLARSAATGRSCHAGARASAAAIAANAERQHRRAPPRGAAEELRLFAGEPLQRRRAHRLDERQRGGEQRRAHPDGDPGGREPQRQPDLGGGNAAHDRGHRGAHAGERRAGAEDAARDPEGAAEEPDRSRLDQHRARELAAGGAQRARQREHAAPLHHRGGEGGGHQHRADEQRDPRERRQVELQGAHHARARARRACAAPRRRRPRGAGGGPRRPGWPRPRRGGGRARCGRAGRAGRTAPARARRP